MVERATGSIALMTPGNLRNVSTDLTLPIFQNDMIK